MHGHAPRISRRLLLATAAVAAGGVLAGCGEVSRLLATIHPPTLALPSPPLLGWQAAVQQAWQRAGLKFHLTFVPQAEAGAPVDADWVSVAMAGGSVRADLTALNFNPASLTQTALRAFTAPNGDLFALPVALGEYQFYGDAARLKDLGIPDRAQWTWADMTRALAASRPAVIDGWGWDDPRLWSALATGLEGNLLLPDGHLDWQKATAATQTLVTLVRDGLLGAGITLPGGGATNLPAFVTSGFGPPPGTPKPDPLWQPVFAFAPPWNMQFMMGYPDHVPFAPSSCAQTGMCALAPRPFPTFPLGSPIPGIPWGLAPRGTSDQPLLGEFATWLYRPTQQRELLILGFAPLTADAATQQAWQRQASGVGTTPRFDPERYFDIASALPIGFWSGAWSTALSNLTTSRSSADVATQIQDVRDNVVFGHAGPDRLPPDLLAVT